MELISIHILKTAGTAFTHLLKTVYPSKVVIPLVNKTASDSYANFRVDETTLDQIRAVIEKGEDNYDSHSQVR